MCSHGLLASMRFALPDGPSLLMLALAIVFAEKRRGWIAAAILALAGLARETNVLGAIALTPSGGRNRRALARVVLQGVLVAAPITLWIAYLWSVGFPSEDTGSRNFAVPLSGYIEKWTASVHQVRVEGWTTVGVSTLLTQIALTTQAIGLVWHRDRDDLWWRTGMVYLGLLLIVGPAVWEGPIAAVTRIGLPMTIAFNLRILPSGRFWPLWILGNCNIPAALEVIGVSVFPVFP